MRVDTASSPGMPGFGELGISPRSVEDMLRELLHNEGPKDPGVNGHGGSQ
jgi:hypothetical protein